MVAGMGAIVWGAELFAEHLAAGVFVATMPFGQRVRRYGLGGLAALTAGSIALVEGVKRLSGIEATQTKLGLTIVGFATAFELVVLAWSASRRGITDAMTS